MNPWAQFFFIGPCFTTPIPTRTSPAPAKTPSTRTPQTPQNDTGNEKMARNAIQFRESRNSSPKPNPKNRASTLTGHRLSDKSLATSPPANHAMVLLERVQAKHLKALVTARFQHLRLLAEDFRRVPCDIYAPRFHREEEAP